MNFVNDFAHEQHLLLVCGCKGSVFFYNDNNKLNFFS